MSFHKTVKVAHGHRCAPTERADDARLAVVSNGAPLHTHRQGEHSSVLSSGVVDESGFKVVDAEDGGHGHVDAVHHLESVDFTSRQQEGPVFIVDEKMYTLPEFGVFWVQIHVHNRAVFVLPRPAFTARVRQRRRIHNI